MPSPAHPCSPASPAPRRILAVFATGCVALVVISLWAHGFSWGKPSQPHSPPALPAAASGNASKQSILAVAEHNTSASDTTLTADFTAAIARDPADALALADQLSARDPANAREIGYTLIAALQRTGVFDRAAAFASASPAPLRRDLVIAAYHEWGRHHPEAAWMSSIRLADPAAREFATQSVLSGWARNNPEELAETALSFPSGPEKTAALTKALRSWMIKAPDKAGAWILAHEVAIPIAENFFASDER